MRSYRTMISSKDVGGNFPTVTTERELDELMGSLKPKPGELSMFEEFFAERELERKREKQ